MTVDITVNHPVVNFIQTVWNDGEVDRVAEFIAPSYTVNGEPFGIAGVQRNVTNWHTAFPNLKLTFEQFVADGDTTAAALIRLTGTQLGEWKDIPPTGAKFDFLEAGFWRIENGLIVSGVFLVDRTIMRDQLISQS